jgi:hypothetical protein
MFRRASCTPLVEFVVYRVVCVLHTKTVKKDCKNLSLEKTSFEVTELIYFAYDAALHFIFLQFVELKWCCDVGYTWAGSRGPSIGTAQP